MYIYTCYKYIWIDSLSVCSHVPISIWCMYFIYYSTVYNLCTCVCKYVFRTCTHKPSIIHETYLHLQHLHSMNNYSSLMALLDGFIMTPIDRLKKTFSKCDKAAIRRVNELQKIMDPAHGFKSLREILAHSTGPCIPYM